jgi:hypothetical protein
MALGQVSCKYFVFPCQFSFHQILHIRLWPGSGTIGQLVVGVPTGLSVTTPQEEGTALYIQVIRWCVVLFVLFCSTLSASEYSTERYDDWKGFGRKRSWRTRNVCMVELRETTKNLSQESRYPGVDSKRAPVKFSSRSFPLHDSSQLHHGGLWI